MSEKTYATLVDLVELKSLRLRVLIWLSVTAMAVTLACLEA